MRIDRSLWSNGHLDLDPERPVFIDGQVVKRMKGATTKMARLGVHAPRGERCRASAPFGRWKRKTFTARIDSVFPGASTAEALCPREFCRACAVRICG